MQLNDKFSVLDLIGAASLSGNSDQAIQALLAQTVLGVEKWPAQAIAQLLDELSDGMSLADPYRAGLVAWACGCLAEIGHSTPRSRDAILHWAESTIQLASSLQERVCETLPTGSLSPQDEFDRRREELGSVLPLEYRAWDALTTCYAAITSTLVRHPELRLRARHLYDKTRQLARHHPTARHIADLILIPHREPFLILEPARGRGVLAAVDGIESMFQFLAVISETFADHFDPGLKLSPAQRAEILGSSAIPVAAPGAGPETVPEVAPEAARELASEAGPEATREPAPEAAPFQTNWTAFHWSALRKDGTLPIMNRDPWEETIGRQRIFAEDGPWDPKTFAGYRVILLQPTEVVTFLLWERHYPELRPSIQVLEVLGAEATNGWITRLARVNELNLGDAEPDESPLQLELQVCNGIMLELSDKWFVGFIARAIRRMVPLARQHWAPLPFDLLGQLLRALNALEAFAFSDEPFAGEELEPLTSAVLDRAVKADRSRLVSPIVVCFAQAVSFWTRKVAHPDIPAGFAAAALGGVQGAWREATMLARLEGYAPDPGLLKEILLADRALLAELSAGGDRPYSDERRLRLADLWLTRRPEWWPLLPEYPRHGLDYEVVLSFAGEDRAHARGLAAALIRRGCRVFFDESERAELLGRELTPLLHSVYRDRSMYCVAFVSQAYADKPWTQLEWAAATERAAAEAQEYILPARLDDTQLPGLAVTVGYLDLRGIAPVDFHRLVAERIQARIAHLLASGI